MTWKEMLNVGFQSYPEILQEKTTPATPSVGDESCSSCGKVAQSKTLDHGERRPTDTDQEYVLDRIAYLAELKKGDRSTESLQELFADYDLTMKGHLNKGDIVRLLDDAGVSIKKLGFKIPQSVIADKIIDALDKSGNRCVSWAEYELATKIHAHVSGARVSAYVGAHVGVITSQEEVIAKVRSYVVDHSSRHDLSRASWKEIWDARFGDGASANQGGISSFLDAADACASLAGGCDGTADKFFTAFNQKLGLAESNGWMTFDQLATFLDLEGPPPPVVPEDPNVISDDDRNAAAVTDAWIDSPASGCDAWTPTMGGSELCRRWFRERRAAAQAKIARIEGGGEKFTGYTVRRDLLPGLDLTTLATKPPAPKTGLGLGWTIGIGVTLIAVAAYFVLRAKDPIR